MHNPFNTVYVTDFNRTVFFSEEATKLGLEKLIEEYRNEEIPYI